MLYQRQCLYLQGNTTTREIYSIRGMNTSFENEDKISMRFYSKYGNWTYVFELGKESKAENLFECEMNFDNLPSW